MMKLLKKICAVTTTMLMAACAVGSAYSVSAETISGNEVMTTVESSDGEAASYTKETLKSCDRAELEKLRDEGELVYDCVVVVIKGEYSKVNQEWSVEDFPVTGVEYIRDLTYMDKSEEWIAEYSASVYFHQILAFYLEEQTYEGMLKTIEELEQSEYILSAEPDGKIHECDLGTSTVSEPLYGDVDGNGRVELADSIILNKVQTGAAFLTDEQFERADVNCDSLVDGIDISYIMQSLVGNVKLIDVAFGEVVE